MDGNADILTSNCSSLDISVVYGAATGQFEAERRIALGPRPGDIAMGDLDRDGFNDIIVQCTELSEMRVFWGEGSRTFSAATRIPCPLGPVRLLSTDLDHDGYLDLAILASTLEGIAVIWGDGTRDPATHTILPLSFHPLVLEVTDLTGDGEVDLATAGCSDDTRLFTLLGRGARQFDAPMVAVDIPQFFPCAVALDDLNIDGVPDAAIVDSGSLFGLVAVAYGKGDGTFGLADTASVGLSPGGIVATDLNGDGLRELAVVNTFVSRTVSVLNGGTFEPAIVLRVGDCPELIRAADIDGDGDPDLMVLNVCSGTVSVHRNSRALREASVHFDPSAYQLRTSGGPISAELVIPPDVSFDFDPARVHLMANGRTLGPVSSRELVDSTLREVRLEFNRALLDGLAPGIQVLSIVGCDPAGTTFHADSTVRIYGERPRLQWQISAVGSLPVKVRVPERRQQSVVMEVHDVSGRLVCRRSVPVTAEGTVTWDGRANSGNRVPSGVYMFTTMGGMTMVRCRVIVLR